jgi:hypothetical protein
MDHPPPNAEDDIRRALLEVEALMSRAFAAVGHSPEPGITPASKILTYQTPEAYWTHGC